MSIHATVRVTGASKNTNMKLLPASVTRAPTPRTRSWSTSTASASSATKSGRSATAKPRTLPPARRTASAGAGPTRAEAPAQVAASRAEEAAVPTTPGSPRGGSWTLVPTVGTLRAPSCHLRGPDRGDFGERFAAVGRACRDHAPVGRACRDHGTATSRIGTTSLPTTAKAPLRSRSGERVGSRAGKLARRYSRPRGGPKSLRRAAAARWRKGRSRPSRPAAQ
jgi:hypothetical protein